MTRAPSPHSIVPSRCGVLVAGAGLAGLSAAFHLERGGLHDVLVVEAADGPGGWARTDWSGPWGADRAIHVLYFRDPSLRALAEDLLGPRLVEHVRRSLVDSVGVRTPYPFHAHLHGRPPGVVLECLDGLWRVSLDANEPMPAGATFADWILRTQGEGVARHFMTPYNTKLWTVPPDAMEWQWTGPFIPRIEPRLLLAGALSGEDRGHGLNATFLYPRHGAGELPEALAAKVARVCYQTRLVALDADAHRATLADGHTVRYDALLSSLPLPELASLLAPLPPELDEARSRLEWTDLVLVDVGFRSPTDRTTHWVYLPDPEVLAYRLHQVHVLSPELAPEGHGLHCVEISHSRHRPLPAGDIVARVVDDLVRTRWLAGHDRVVFTRVRRFPCAYSIPLSGADEAAKRLVEYARTKGIHCIGRYGAWRYGSQEDALRDGRDVATGLIGARTAP